MAIALSWKIGGVAVGLIAAGLAWNGLSRYLAARQANEIIQESARAAAMEAEQAKAQAQQRHLELAANLQHRQEELCWLETSNAQVASSSIARVRALPRPSARMGSRSTARGTRRPSRYADAFRSSSISHNVYYVKLRAWVWPGEYWP